MKKTLTILILIFTALTINAQFVINSKFRPLSYEELLLHAQATAARDAYNKARFEEYTDKAYDLLNHGNKQGFITYSNYALQTGWYNAKLYYDRGEVFLSFGDYKNAKKEYKKAKRKGYYLAESALQRLKVLRKRK